MRSHKIKIKNNKAQGFSISESLLLLNKINRINKYLELYDRSSRILR